MEEFSSCSNFLETLRYLIAMNSMISTITGYTLGDREMYWSRTIKLFNSTITQKNIKEYNKNNTPDNERFPGLKAKVREIFELFRDEINRPITSKVEELDQDGKIIKIKTKVNDDWLRINTNNLSNDDDMTNYYSSMSKNNGISLTILKRSDEERRQGKIDNEFPLSEFYMVLLYVFKVKGIKNPHYPYCFLYGLYQLFRHSLSQQELNDNPFVLKVIEDLIKAGVLNTSNDKSNEMTNKVQSFIRPLIDSNKAQATDLFSKVKQGTRELNISQIDQVANSAHSAIKAISSKNGNFTESMNTLTGSNLDENELKEKMDTFGINAQNIKAVIDNFSTESSMTNEQLQETIPKDINDFFNFSAINNSTG